MPRRASPDQTQVRIARLVAELYAGQELSSGYIRRRFGVSKATAVRDLLTLELALPLVVDRGLNNGSVRQKLLRLEAV